jgi:hypothetical protein
MGNVQNSRGGRWRASGVRRTRGAENELDFRGGIFDLARAAHVVQRQIGYQRIAQAGSYSGRIRFPFDSAPRRSNDAAGGGGDSVKLKWETQLCGVKKKIFNPSQGTRVAGVISLFFFFFHSHACAPPLHPFYLPQRHKDEQRLPPPADL